MLCSFSQLYIPTKGMPRSDPSGYMTFLYKGYNFCDLFTFLYTACIEYRNFYKYGNSKTNQTPLPLEMDRSNELR